MNDLTPEEQAAAREMAEQLARHKRNTPTKPLFQQLADSVRGWIRPASRRDEDPRMARLNHERQRREEIVKKMVGDEAKTLNWMFWRQVKPNEKEAQTTAMAEMVNSFMRTAMYALYKRLSRHYGINGKYFPHQSVRYAERAELRLTRERVRKARQEAA